MKVVHIITSLEDGGAEAVLYRLCINDSRVKHIVITLKDQGKYGSLLHNNGIEVHYLNMSAGHLSFLSLLKLYKKLRQLKPDIVQTWMYHANLIGGVVAYLTGMKNIYWGIHNTTLDKSSSKRTTIWINKFCALLSYWIPKKIICCAYRAAEVHSALGYSPKKMIVIANGYEFEQFREDPLLTTQMSNELSLRKNMSILGMVARFDTQKDHLGLLQALQQVKAKNSYFSFLLVGKGLNEQNSALIKEINKLGLQDNILLLGQRSDIPSIMNMLDIHVLSSACEAFPNVLAEAMACGTPCITTDVGDAALIVGGTGWVVPPLKPDALAQAILQALNEKLQNPESWVMRKQQCRERIVENFDIMKMVKNYHIVWRVK